MSIAVKPPHWRWVDAETSGFLTTSDPDYGGDGIYMSWDFEEPGCDPGFKWGVIYFQATGDNGHYCPRSWILA